MSDKPLIIQSDRSLLLDVHAQDADTCRNDIIPFAELVKAPEHLHTYMITPLSLWNALSAGFTGDRIVQTLEKWSRYDFPTTVRSFIIETCSRYGSICLVNNDSDTYALKCKDNTTYRVLLLASSLRNTLLPSVDDNTFLIRKFNRGNVKLALIKLGYPVDDRIPLVKGDPISINLKAELRDYQRLAVNSVYGNGGPGTGFGTVVMPCGSGKTVTGIALMERLQTRTLILCPNVIAVRQWIRELSEKSDIDMNLVGEYSGEKKEIKPVTVATYQILTYRPEVDGSFPHMNLISRERWGLVIYDEVHLLPAPVFRFTAELQSIYRIGLTATLVREDGHEEDVFSLVGPKRYDVPWIDLEQKGWISQANCVEVRVPMDQSMVLEYASSNARERFSLASNNPQKMKMVSYLLQKHKGEGILIIGQYLDQLKEISNTFGYPLITGSTSNSKRAELYNAFREGTLRVLVVSKVANFAIDLPDASVAIQVSGTFGSRQEEAQRLGRILRPKKTPCYFYTLVTKYSVEEEFSANRRKFLIEQGYRYSVYDN